MDHHFVRPSDKAAFLHHLGAVSYDAFFRKIGAFALMLPIEPGDRVLLYGPNSIEWAVAFYAVWRKGGIVVPLDFSACIEDLVFMVRDADARMALTHSSAPGQLLGILEGMRAEPWKWIWMKPP